MNKPKRQLFPSVAIIAWNHQDCLAGDKCNKIFEIGCVLQTHGKITTLPADCGTMGQGHGSSEATRSQNGRHLGSVLFSGSLGNVSYHVALYSFPEANTFSRFAAGSGKSVLRCVNFFI